MMTMTREPPACITWHGPQPDIRCTCTFLGPDRERKCAAVATHIVRWSPGRLEVIYGRTDLSCEDHTAAAREFIAQHPARPSTDVIVPLVRDPRVAACVVGAITGATPPDLAALLRAGSTDPAALEVALDHVEARGLYLPDAWPTDAGVEWPRVNEHGTGNNPHVWFLCFEEAEGGGRGPFIAWSQQCTCGLFETEHGAFAQRRAHSERLDARIPSRRR